jgi:hypothetical protein
MKKILLTLAVLALPTAAFATGMDVSWNDCVGSGFEASNVAFACSNTGTTFKSYNLVFQFKLAEALPGFVGVSAFCDIQTSTYPAPLSPFWHYEAGGCQRLPSPALQGIALFDNIQLLPGCVSLGMLDPWNGDGSGGFEGIAAYGPDFGRPGVGHFILGDAAPAAFPLDPDVNYYAWHMQFNTKNRSAASNGSHCVGCEQQAATVLNTMILESNDGHPPVMFQSPNFDKYGNCGSMNGGSSICGATAVKNTTWGQLKALYR